MYCTVLCRRSLCSMVLRRLRLFATVVESTACVLLYDIAYLCKYFAVFYSTVYFRHCSALQCTVLYITVLCRRSLCSMVLRRLWLLMAVDLFRFSLKAPQTARVADLSGFLIKFDNSFSGGSAIIDLLYQHVWMSQKNSDHSTYNS